MSKADRGGITSRKKDSYQDRDGISIDDDLIIFFPDLPDSCMALYFRISFLTELNEQPCSGLFHRPDKNSPYLKEDLIFEYHASVWLKEREAY
jgi:hypothetical protein